MREWINQTDQLDECVKYLTDLDHIYHSPMQKTVTSMYESEIVEYTNRHRMEETTAKVLARLHHMKSVLCKTIKSKFQSSERRSVLQSPAERKTATSIEWIPRDSFKLSGRVAATHLLRSSDLHSSIVV